MPRRPWRLLVDGPADGPWNMGVDEALMESAAAGAPALRLYAWSGPWLSLGYAQRLTPERRAACAAAGVGVVRRVTGGAAVLHGGDLTYAVAAPEALLPAGLRASYAAVADGLSAALRGLGVSVERSAGPAAAGPTRGFDCFADPSGDELCVAGRKLVGSAQRRAGGAVLQHGSLRLSPDPPDARRAAGLAERSATSLAELGVETDPERLAASLTGALADALGARWKPSGLRPEERIRAARRAGEPRGPRGGNTRGGSQGSPSQADT